MKGQACGLNSITEKYEKNLLKGSKQIIRN